MSKIILLPLIFSEEYSQISAGSDGDKSELKLKRAVVRCQVMTQVRLSGSQTCPALNFRTHTPHVGAQNKRKQVCHLDHYPPSPTATVDHPESSYSLYSAVQESEQLIRNLAETTHRGCSAFQQGIRGVYAADGGSRSCERQPRRPLGSQASSSSFAYVHSCISKQATCTVHTGIHSSTPHSPILQCGATPRRTSIKRRVFCSKPVNQ